MQLCCFVHYFVIRHIYQCVYVRLIVRVRFAYVKVISLKYGILFHFISWIVTKCIHLWYKFLIYLRYTQLIIIEVRCHVIFRRPVIDVVAMAKREVTYRTSRGCLHSCLFSAPQYIAICASPALSNLSTCVIQGTIFRKPLLNIKRAFRFFLQLLSKTFLILRKLQWHAIITM